MANSSNQGSLWSREYLAVKGHMADINRRVPEADLPSFSSELLQAGLITDAAHIDAIAVTGMGPGHKIASLTAEVMTKIKTTPKLFYSFVEILETRDEDIATNLRSYCSTASRLGEESNMHYNVDHTLAVYADGLKRVYQTPPTTWLPLPVSKHIKLAMTKEKGMRYGRDTDEMMRHRVKGEIEQVMACKELVDMNSIFDVGTPFSRRPLVILVEGALGSGKTTLAHHYCHEWANGNLAMFDLVALIYLRHPAVHSAESSISLDELLLVASESNQERDIVGKVVQFIKDGLKFLLILEGWDEAPAKLRAPPDPLYPSDNSFLGKLIRSVSSNTTILITSRPDSSLDLHNRTNVRVEILGFTKESIHEYFHEALSTQLSSDEVTAECSKLKEHFSKYPAIESSCYIPLNAAILTLVYLKRNRTLPTTQYELFCELLICCIEREVNTRQPNRILKSISSLNDFPADLKEQIKNISRLAYEGVKENKIVFSQQEISSQQDLPSLGVLQKVQWGDTHSKKMSYSFSHLSIQELLAAYCISKKEDSEQVIAFKSLSLDNPRFAAVLQFYAGFTKLTNKGVVKIITEMTYSHSLLTFLRCFFEARVTDDSLYRLIPSRINGSLDLSWATLTLSPLDCMSIGYFLPFALRHSKLRVDLSYKGLDDHLLGLLLGEFSKHMHASTLHEVTELRVRGGKWHIEEGISSLARALTVNWSLRELNISHNKISVNGVVQIANALQSNKTLKTLAISVSDEGVESLAKALKFNTTLETLELHWESTRIDKIMEKIGECVCNNNRLRVLEIYFEITLIDFDKFQLLLAVGGSKLMQSLQHNQLRTLLLYIGYRARNQELQTLRAAELAVNLARKTRKMKGLDLLIF